jgi:hypothetical protein
MYTYASIFTFLFFGLIFNDLSAQIPDNFEHLNHEFRLNELGASKVFNDEVYYVNHRKNPFTTSVYKVNEQNEVEELFFTYCDSNSKLIENPDASFDIILFNLVDYDFQTDDFITIHVDTQDIQIDKFFSYDLGVYLHDIYKNENNQWVGFNAFNYFIFDDTSVVDTADFSDLIFYELFNNANQSLFGLREDENSDKSILYKLVDGATDSITIIEGSSIVQNLHNNKIGNYLLSSNRLLQYSVDFSELIDFWELDLFNGDITSVNSLGEKVEVLIDGGRLYELQEGGEIELISENLLNPGENNAFFHRLGNEHLIFGGEHDFQSASNNVYFRNVNVIDNSNVEYPRVDLSLEDLELLRNNQDGSLNLKMNIVNNGIIAIDSFNLYSRLFDPDAPISFWRFIEEKFIDLDVEESINLDRVLFANQLQNFSIAVPGGDYMFNANPNGLWIGDELSSITDVDINNSLILSPNPSGDFIHVETQEKILSICIYNHLGQIVYFKSSQSHLVDNVISVSHLDSGLYSLAAKLANTSKLITAKFVKN